MNKQTFISSTLSLTFRCTKMYPHLICCRARLKPDGTRWRTGKWRGNWRMEWVASTLTLPRNVVYPALLTLMHTSRLPLVDWPEAPADLNGLVRFGERRSLFSERVPSLFKCSLRATCSAQTTLHLFSNFIQPPIILTTTLLLDSRKLSVTLRVRFQTPYLYRQGKLSRCLIKNDSLKALGGIVV
jgi:hypothetical protein